MTFVGQGPSVSGCVERVHALRATERDYRRPTHDREVTGAMGCPPRHTSQACFTCSEVGHFAKDCPKRGQRQDRAGRRSFHNPKPGYVLKCYFCDEDGHVKKDCPKQKEWLARDQQPSKASAAVSGPAEKCFSLQDTDDDSYDLPHIFVNTQSIECDNDWHRVRAVIDSGSSRSLVESKLVADLGLQAEVYHEPLFALNGEALSI